MFDPNNYLQLLKLSGTRVQVEFQDSQQLLIYIFVMARPGSKKQAIEHLPDGELKIFLAAPPIEGKANLALIEYLSETLGVAKRDLELIKGAHGRSKKLLIRLSELSDEKEQKRWAKFLALFPQSSLS